MGKFPIKSAFLIISAVFFGSVGSAGTETGVIHSFAHTQFIAGAPNLNATMWDAVRITPFADVEICASNLPNALITITAVLPVHPREDNFDQNEICGVDFDDCVAGTPFGDLIEACLADGHPTEICCFDTDCIDSVAEVRSIVGYLGNATITINGEEPAATFRHPQSGSTKYNNRIFSNFDELAPACDALYAEHSIPRPTNGQCFSSTTSASPGNLAPGEYQIHTEAQGDIFGPYDMVLTVLDC